MELRHLTTFVAVAEEGGFTAAAKRLGVVQSAVSSGVRALERDLGQALFDRTTRRVALTDAGTALLPEARRVLAALDAARDAVGAVQGGLRGTVRLGVMHAQALRPLAVPALLAAFRADHPDVEIRITHGPTSAEKARQVRDGQLDLAFVGLAGPPPPGVQLTPVRRDTMAVLCHRDHPLAGATAVELGALVEEPFVDGPPGSASRATNDVAFAAAGVPRHVPYEVNDTRGMVDLVIAGLAVAILPPALADGVEELRTVPIARGAPVLDIALASPSNRPMGAAATALASRIRESAAR